MQIETIVRVIGANNIKVNTLNHITYNDCSLNSALLDVIVPHSFSLLHRLFDFRHHQQIILTAEKIDNIVYYICTSHWVISFNKTTDILHSSAYFCMLQLWELVCVPIFAISLKMLSVFVITLQQEKTKQRKDKIVTQTYITLRLKWNHKAKSCKRLRPEQLFRFRCLNQNSIWIHPERDYFQQCLFALSHLKHCYQFVCL